MSDILFADKKLLQSYNTYNQDNFNHGYDEKESRKDINHQVYQFLLNDKGKFCIFYLNKNNSDKLQSMKIPNNLIN